MLRVAQGSHEFMSKRICLRTVVALVFAVALATGCAKQSPAIAPITTAADATPSPGKFVWHDLLTEDVDAVKKFYGELFGWEYRSTALPNYHLIEHDGRTIGGIVDMSEVDPAENQSQWVSLLSVPDVAEAVRVTRGAGGEIHVEPVEIPGRGTLAVVSDPRGALIGYVKAIGGDPPDRDAALGEFMWDELWTDDLEDSYEFYRDLIGYNLEEKIILEDEEYIVFQSGSRPRAGVIVRPVEEVRSNWLPYLRVDDPAALSQRVEALGGHVLLSPDDEIREGTVAIVMDPSGAAVALQKWDQS
jgi:predicted enzyme related to lactoylglutathione lyase